MPGDELLETALRVLNAYVARKPPDPADVEVLRASAAGPGSNLDPDALAVYVVQRELRKKGPRGPAPE